MENGTSTPENIWNGCRRGCNIDQPSRHLGKQYVENSWMKSVLRRQCNNKQAKIHASQNSASILARPTDDIVTVRGSNGFRRRNDGISCSGTGIGVVQECCSHAIRIAWYKRVDGFLNANDKEELIMDYIYGFFCLNG